MRETGELLSIFISIKFLAINTKQEITRDTARQLCIWELTPPCVTNHSTIYSIVYQSSDTEVAMLYVLEINCNVDCPFEV